MRPRVPDHALPLAYTPGRADVCNYSSLPSPASMTQKCGTMSRVPSGPSHPLSNQTLLLTQFHARRKQVSDIRV